MKLTFPFVYKYPFVALVAFRFTNSLPDRGPFFPSTLPVLTHAFTPEIGPTPPSILLPQQVDRFRASALLC